MTDGREPLARERLEMFLDGAERTNIDDLILVALPTPDPQVRARRLAAVTNAATAAGRAALLDEARARARTTIVQGFARRAYDPTWFGLNWGRSLGRSADRAALIAAAEDAAAATVVEDVIDAEIVGDLGRPFQLASSMQGAAPATNPSFGSERVGLPGRLALVLVVGLTLSGGIGGLLLAILAWLQSQPLAIELF